jgi:hypothetical protein
LGDPPHPDAERGGDNRTGNAWPHRDDPSADLNFHPCDDADQVGQGNQRENQSGDTQNETVTHVNIILKTPADFIKNPAKTDPGQGL